MARPKRKATENKSYEETLEYTLAEDDSAKRPKSSSSPASAEVSGTLARRNSSKGGKQTSPPATKTNGVRLTNGANGQKSGANGTKSGANGTKGGVNGTKGGAKATSKAKESATNHSPESSGSLTPGLKSDSEDARIPTNWQPTPKPIDYFSNKLNLKGAYINLTQKCLVCPGQPHLPMDYNDTFKRRKNFTLRKGDFIYMISEPPGEPYYIGRISGFKTKGESITTTSSTNGSSDATKFDDSSDEITHDVQNYTFQIQWFYRPRDISKSSVDSRILFASMHTDTCPLNSFRGVAIVKHRQEIESLDEYLKLPNRFFFDKLYDRYMIKFYDILSTKYLRDISQNEKSHSFLLALNKRFEYIFVEPSMTKFLINGLKSNSCTCEVCGQWCSTQDSVDCVNCNKFYHMTCLDPPLLKKPSRGFSWTCESCTKIHMRQYKNNKMFMLSHDNKLSTQLSDDEHDNDSEKDVDQDSEMDNEKDPSSSNEKDTNDYDVVKDASDVLPKYELMAQEFLKSDKLSFEERRLKEEWCMRYLGMHSKLEDAVDLEDRSPYPRASTRIGPKHQAHHIPEYIDHPIVYYDGKQETGKTNKRQKKVAASEEVKPLPVPEEYANVNPKDYPQWLQPRPKGYIERGVDDGEGETCTLLWKSRQEDIDDDFQNLDKYIEQCKPIAEALELSPNSPNFVDAILYNYMRNNGDVSKAIDECLKITKKTLKEPQLTPDQIKQFEEGVRKYGSELYPIYQLMKGVSCSDIVRFYYLWKKTKNGRLIWGNYEGRLKKKFQNIQNESKDSQSKLHMFKLDDDSSYDSTQVSNKEFSCKHCDTTTSTQWFRLAGFDTNITTNDANKKICITGLCFRCAKLWRRYAAVWEDPIEVDRKITKNGKKKIEAELLRDTELILSYADQVGGLIGDDKRRDIKRKVSPSPSDLDQDKTKKKPANEPKSKAAVKNDADPKREADPKRKPESQKSGVTKKVKSEKPKLEVDTQVKATKSKPGPKPKPKSDSNDGERKATPPPMPYEIEHLINPILSRNYIPPAELNLVLNKSNKRPISQKKLENLVKSFKIKRLCDLSHLINDDSTIDSGAPFKSFESTCDICKEPNQVQEGQEQDTLSCGKCGISVHPSCVGISLPASLKSVPEWLCDCCINDMNPIFQYRDYTCCLCDQKGGYMKAVYETGDWCHLLCAIFSYKQIDIKLLNHVNHQNLKNILEGIKDEKVTLKLIIENIANNLEISCVDRVFAGNLDKRCWTCGKSGGVVKCNADTCDKYYHITCAMPNSKYGFQLNEQDPKVKVGHSVGKLDPCFVCCDHGDSSKPVYGLRSLGKKSQSSREELPLIQMFIDDLIKSNTNKLTGGQFRAYNYLNLVKEIVLKEENKIPANTSALLPRCVKCYITTSPIWWEKHGQQVCQHCYHEENEDNEEEFSSEFGYMADEPIPGPYFGICGPNDSVAAVHTPLSLKGNTS